MGGSKPFPLLLTGQRSCPVHSRTRWRAFLPQYPVEIEEREIAEEEVPPTRQVHSPTRDSKKDRYRHLRRCQSCCRKYHR